MTGPTAEEQLRTEVRSALACARLSQAEACRQLGLSTKYMNQMLMGHAPLTLRWAEKIVALCGARVLVYVTAPPGAADRVQRIRLDDLTSDQLDALYDDLDRADEVIGELNQHNINLARRAARRTK